MVGAERIELPTSCSQSKRATAALRPENWCWWPVPISGYALRSMPRGPRLLIRVLSNRRHSYAVDSPTLNPCVTRAGFRHLRTRHRLTTQLRAVKSHPRFPAATGTPEARYCAQGFDVGPRHLRGLGYGRFQGGSWAYHSPQWPVRIRGLRPTQASPSSPFG